MAVTLKSIAARPGILALALSALALPVAAAAQDAELQIRDNEAAGNIGGDNEARRAPRSAPRGEEGGGWTRPVEAAPRIVPAPPMPAAQPSPPRAAEGGWNARSWENRAPGNWRGDNARPAPAPVAQAAPAPVGQGRNWGDRRDGGSEEARRADRAGRWWGRDDNRAGRDTAQRRDDGDRWRDRSRDDYRRNDDRRWANRGWDNRGWSTPGWDNRGNQYRYGYNRDFRRWDNRWRDNRRYDWYSYRRTYPGTYRLGAYYAPYRNYSYRRLSIGFFLDSLFFSSRYWINDPWQYRLPEVYGPYRWVRYYDDALLVNIYTGEVADVIYSFFW